MQTPDADPVVQQLKNELAQWGATIQFFPGQASPETGNGAEFATADWYLVAGFTICTIRIPARHVV